MAAYPSTGKDGQHFHSSFACPSSDQFKEFIRFWGHNIIDYILKLKSLEVKMIIVTSDRVEGGHISERMALEVKDVEGKLQRIYVNRESLLQGHERKIGDSYSEDLNSPQIIHLFNFSTI